MSKIAIVSVNLPEVLSMFICHYIRVCGESPILESVDIEGPDGDSVYISWVEDDEGNTDSVEIPHNNLDSHVTIKNGDTLVVYDTNDNLVEIQFYPAKPISIGYCRFLVHGRKCGDDDDTAMVVMARDEGDATDQLLANLLDDEMTVDEYHAAEDAGTLEESDMIFVLNVSKID